MGVSRKRDIPEAFAKTAALNACYSSPAGAGYNRNGIQNGIVTVAATDVADQEASFSNFGVCVNIWAPGVSVITTSRARASDGTRITTSLRK